MVTTDAFAELARQAAEAAGCPHLPLVIVAHPVGGLARAAVLARAEAAVDGALAALTRDPGPPVPTPPPPAARWTAPDDLEAFQAFALAQGWGDGLPVLPPTPERVGRIVGARRPHDVVARLAPRHGLATVEVVAANAALAGAGPEHLPVILAAVRAVAEPAFNLAAVQTTTHPCTPLVVVNGPIRHRLSIACAGNALGQGHRANAVIGRALRLTLQNVGGARPGAGDRATLGHPGKFTYCLGEHEEASPWEPLHVDRGFERGVSTVTVCAAEAPHNVNDHGSTSAEGLVRTLASTLAVTGCNNVYLGGELLVLLSPEHAATVASSGWSKHDLQRALWERARVPLGAFSPENLERFAVLDPARFAGRAPEDTVAPTHAPEELLVVVAGGPGKHSALVFTFGATRAVTVAVDA